MHGRNHGCRLQIVRLFQMLQNGLRQANHFAEQYLHRSAQARHLVAESECL